MSRGMSLTRLQPADLPVPPERALRIVNACNSGDVGAQDLGALVESDPVIAAQLLRIANSAYFGTASKVTSLPRAIAVIGQRALRNLVLCVAVRGSVKAKDLPALPVDSFWECSLRRAVCARALAAHASVDEDICFAVGLLQDFGLLVLFFLHRDRIFDWPTLVAQTPEERLLSEAQLFGSTHDEVGEQLAMAWDLPQEIASTMGGHHRLDRRADDTPNPLLCKVAKCADWMAAVFTARTNAKRHTIKSCRSLLHELFGIDSERADRMLDQVARDMEQAASALGFPVAEQVSYSQMMEQANLQLLHQNLSMQEINWQLEQLVEERDQAAAELQQELDLAREVQRSLLPLQADVTSGIFGINVSARTVSGDFYDFFTLRDGRIAFCVADVSGKGMHAALLMAKTSSLFHCLGKSVHDPGKLLAMLNREISETSIRGMFITMAAGVIDPESTRVTLANAGHLPAVQLRGSEKVAEFGANGPPLGVIPDAVFANHELVLGHDSLYLFTDGLVEARVADGHLLGLAGLTRELARHNGRDARERLQQIMAKVTGMTSASDDDMTLLLIQRD